MLVAALALSNFKRREVILRAAELATRAHILLAGIARITCLSARGERVTVAMLAPGPIPEFPALPMSQSDFRCEAFNDCRVGSVSWEDLDGITVNASESAFKKFHQNDLKQWYRLLLRSSSSLNLGLHERIAMTLLELCSDFGIEESRGTLLRVSFSHKDIANLVGASRPRVTEHLAQLAASDARRHARIVSVVVIISASRSRTCCQRHRIGGLRDARGQPEHELALRDILDDHLIHHVNDGAGRGEQRACYCCCLAVPVP